jgi:hypothetical protein
MRYPDEFTIKPIFGSDQLHGHQPLGSDQPHTSPEEAAKDRECTLMRFPKKVLLSHLGFPHGQILFPEGIRPIPTEFSTHWYLKACGVTLATDPGPGDLPEAA